MQAEGKRRLLFHKAGQSTKGHPREWPNKMSNKWLTAFGGRNGQMFRHRQTEVVKFRRNVVAGVIAEEDKAAGSLRAKDSRLASVSMRAATFNDCLQMMLGTIS